jgi:acetyltransferase-like isoleucine patch superfamily enzyme
MIDPTAFIDPWAKVDTGSVSIGARTRVWQFSSVIRGSVVGADCSIASNAIVDGASLGDGVIVSHGAFIDPGILIGSGVFLGPGAKLCNDGWPRAHKRGFDMNALLYGGFITTVIGDGATICAGAIVLAGIVIGERAFIAAGSVVNRNVPPDTLWKHDGRTAPITEDLTKRMRRADVGWPGTKADAA